MSFDQLRESHLLNSLHRQLRSFGLDPRDWLVERTNLDEYLRIEMVHRSDTDFRIEASVSQVIGSELQVNRLMLASL